MKRSLSFNAVAQTRPVRRRTGRTARILGLAAGLGAGGIVALVPSGSAFADTYTVNSTADSGPGSLRQAIIDSNNDFGPDDIVLDLTAGSTITLASDLPSVNDALKIAASASGITVDGANSFRALTVSGDLTLSGFAIDNMVAPGGLFGAAAHSSGTTMTIDQMSFDGNSGSAISMQNGSLVVTDSAFTNNTGTNGGAIRFFAQNSSTNTMNVSGSMFEDNVATSFASGGAIGIPGGGVSTIVDSTFTSNQTSNAGGAIRAVDAVLSISGSTLSENTAVNGAALEMDVIDGSPFALPGSLTVADTTFSGNIASVMGGAVLIDETPATFERTTFADNGALSGGALRIDAADVTIDGSTFSGNSASDDGGALSLTGVAPGAGVLTSLTMTNSTASGNTATESGAVLSANNRSSSTIRHSTLTGNTAGTGGGAAESDGPLTIDHSIIAENSSTAGGADIEGTVTNLTWSILGDSTGVTLTSSSNNLLDEDPLLEPLTDNGGPTATRRPAPGSPAIDAGDPAFGGAPAIDQRGLARVNGGRIDIGALETNQGTFTVTASSSTVEEGEEITFTVARLGGGDGAASVDLDDGAGTATPVDDHAALDETFNWADGDQSDRTVTIAIAEDIDDDIDETLVATLSNPTGATLGSPASATVTITNVPTPFVIPVAPARLVDTRTGETTIDGAFAAEGRRPAGSTLTLEVVGRAAIPADATAVVMNVTAVRPDGTGFVTAYPCDDPQPTASSLNYTTGQNLGNEIIARLSPAGTVCLFTFAAIDLTADAVGYVPANSPYRPQTPARMMDTRIGAETVDGDFSGDGVRPADTEFELQITGRNDVPVGAAAAVVNITAVNPQAPGFVTVHPCEAVRPVASSLNYVPGVNRGNEIVAKLSPAGALCIYNSAAMNITVDIVGWLPAAASFTPIAPARFVDSRPGQVTIDGRLEGFGELQAGDSLRIKIAGRGEVPDLATAAVVNLAAIRPTGVGFFTVWDCVGDPPLASSLNYITDVNGSSEIIAGLNSIGELCVFSPTTSHFAIDVVGYAS